MRSDLVCLASLPPLEFRMELLASTLCLPPAINERGEPNIQDDLARLLRVGIFALWHFQVKHTSCSITGQAAVTGVRAALSLHRSFFHIDCSSSSPCSSTLTEISWTLSLSSKTIFSPATTSPHHYHLLLLRSYRLHFTFSYPKATAQSSHPLFPYHTPTDHNT